MNLNKILIFLKKFFTNNQLNIQLAFVFGSLVKGYYTKESDIDIAILFENKPDLNMILELKANLENALTNEVDIAILNDASPVLKMQVLKNGILIFKKNDMIYNKFFVDTINQYDDLKRVRKECEKNILKGRIYGR